MNCSEVRVSWNEARGFCQWLSEQTGERFDLPTEAEWNGRAAPAPQRSFLPR